MLASEIFSLCSKVAEDRTFVTYTSADWIEGLNDAQRAVCLVRPDAKVAVGAVQLTAGTCRQTLPAGSTRLMAVLRNMGADGATPGYAVRGPTPRETMDSMNPAWSNTAGAYVREYVYGEETPLVFDVYPYVAGPWWLDLKRAVAPTNIAAAGDAIDLADIYAPPISEWMLYRAFARDSERTPNFTRAARHLANFYQLLGVKTRADISSSPKVVENDKQIAAASGR